MSLGILWSEIVAHLSVLPWWIVLLLAVGTFLFSSVWYGAIFGDVMLRLRNVKKEECSMNVFACVVQFVEFLVLAYFLALLVSAVTSFSLLLLIIDAFFGTLFFGLLAGHLFTHSNRSVAWKLWGIHVGFYTIAISAMTTILYLFMA